MPALPQAVPRAGWATGLEKAQLVLRPAMGVCVPTCPRQWGDCGSGATAWLWDVQRLVSRHHFTLLRQCVLPPPPQ